MSIRYEFDRLQPGSDKWDRSSFHYWPQVFGPTPPTDERVASEMLIIQANRHREGTRFRLVKIEETLIGEEVESPAPDKR